MNLKIKINKWKFSKILFNKQYNFSRLKVTKYLSNALINDAYNTISKWKNYKKTPLIKLNKLSKELNLNNVFYKDESKRFHLKSFKALGGAFAVDKIAKGKKDIIISSATAGNHGRSVAWGAQRLGLKCKIFISQYVSKNREKEIKKLGAQVIRVKGNYESSLKKCQIQSKINKWKIVQDVSNKKYKYIPKLTMAGYSLMIKEISNQTNKYITHIFLQAGVGGMAAGAVAGVARYFKRIPKIIIVEPDSAPCVLKSIEGGKMTRVKINKQSIMGGMSCSEMSLVPWQILKNTTNCCVSIKDTNISKTIALLHDKKLSKIKIVGGECSAPGVISLVSVCNNKKVKNRLEINENSNILLIGCEGDADNLLYEKLLKIGKKKLNS